VGKKREKEREICRTDHPCRAAHDTHGHNQTCVDAVTREKNEKQGRRAVLTPSFLILFVTEMAEFAAAELLLEAVPEVNTVLTLCGFANPVNHACLVDGKDLDVLDLFGDFTDSLIDNMADRNEKRTPAVQCVCFGVQRILHLKAVAHWVHQKHHEGIAPNIAELNIEIICENTHEMTIDSAVDTKRDDKMFFLDKFNSKKYVSWARSFENYLDSVHGKAKVPLSYVIHPEGVNPADAVDEYQHILWQTPHAGITYNDDNQEVYHIYKDLMIATDGWTWFNRAPNGDGCAAHLIIKHHYHGDAETAVRAAEAEACIVCIIAMSWHCHLNNMSLSSVNALNLWLTMSSSCLKHKR
jgi:hypothetical protein